MNNIAKYRKQKGWSQLQLAEKMSISRSTLSMWETSATEPSFEQIMKLCDLFDITPEQLMTDRVLETNKKIKIPVVGEIRAGLPTFADENIIDYEEVPEEMVKDGEYFGLKVKGDSMLPRIVEGDVVIVRKQNTADNGDICVVLVNGDSATLKKVKFADNGIMLIPNNQMYETMFYSKKEIQDLPVEIVGKVVELRGKF